MKPLADCLLYGFIDTAYLRGRSASDIAEQLCRGGADLIQLRGKNNSQSELHEMAKEIAPMTRAADVGLVINDYLEIAKDVGADFCHLGQEDFFGAGHKQACELRGPDGILRIGLSTHAAAQAWEAMNAGADYIAVGPVYATGTKPTATPVTLEYVRWAAQNVKLPWFAIGGITLNNIGEVLAAGASRICVVSAILNANDIAQACSEFKKRLLNQKQTLST
jgi:thiamine-phosphate pyrophosphorylase